MWGTQTVQQAVDQLRKAVMLRYVGKALPPGVDVVRTPVALAFVRGDRAQPGRSYADQVIGSYGYWNRESAEHLDLVFFGWGSEDGQKAHYIGNQSARSSGCKMCASGTTAFEHCCHEFERMTGGKWRYREQTDIVLLNFELPVRASGAFGGAAGGFDLSTCIPISVETLVQEGRVLSLDALVREIMNAAEDIYEKHPLQSTVFEVSDRIGWLRGRRALWDWFLATFLRGGKAVYDELRYFAVCDLRPDAAPSIRTPAVT